MKAVFVRLSGSEPRSVEILKKRFPEAELVALSRSILETGGLFDRIRSVRQHRPDVFAVMTESLDWQYGQIALMLFGALAGARESFILDMRGNMRSEKRLTLLLTGPARIANCFVRGKLGVERAKSKLAELEQANDAQWPRRKTSPLKIIYLRTTPSAGTQPGGATSHINGVVKGLIELNAEVRFIANDEIAGLGELDIAFEKISPEPDLMPRAVFDIANGIAFAAAASDKIAADPPSFIYERYSRFSIAGVEASRRTDVPLFLEYNGSEVWVGKHWDSTARLDLLGQYEHLNLAAATRIFTISEIEKVNLLAAGVPAEKIVVNPNGVDPDKFRPAVGGEAERKAMGIDDTKIVVGFVGSFGPWHGIEVLAEAIALVPRDRKIEFLLIGDGSLRPEIERRLTDSGDLDRSIFTGSVSHDRVPVLLDACDILVSPHVPLADGSEFFGSPTKLFEYMAMGKGIVASRLGQIGDVLEDGVTALLVKPADARELSAAVVRLAADADLLSRLGQAARDVAIARHTWRRNAETILHTFEAL